MQGISRSQPRLPKKYEMLEPQPFPECFQLTIVLMLWKGSWLQDFDISSPSVTWFGVYRQAILCADRQAHVPRCVGGVAGAAPFHGDGLFNVGVLRLDFAWL